MTRGSANTPYGSIAAGVLGLRLPWNRPAGFGIRSGSVTQRHPPVAYRSFARLLTGVVMVHVAFGCGGHHAHACDAGCREAAAAPCPGPCRDREYDRDPADAALSDQSDRGCQGQPHHRAHRCEGDACKSVPTESSQDSGSEHALGYSAAFVLPPTSFAQMADPAVSVVPSASDVASCTPRLHLVLAVLLI